ncbi:uncharacterized protein MEPE_02841 [Melanopsichium pennsylvanicum]|uniref:Phosphatidic acid phosphatase type 2/haloperoxidase domain-containing protein n=1 Tax=Melanopsichium pennsylvanicum TaxID=63383 RepID=A0AAJ5C527_9BASI|nr:uncharacterized protein MEPE_02841 [Melanopsichium pennsylvanicum]
MHRWERATLNGSGNAKRPIDKPQEQLSTALWLLEHTQSIVTTATAIGILHLRTCHALYFTIGSLATSFTAKGLKKVIKQPRPPGSRVKKTSGMPSTHSATISFMGTYIVLLSLFLPLHPSLSLASTFLEGDSAASDKMVRSWMAIIGFVTPVLVMWSRVRLGVHTPAQTLAGAALGVAKACIWFTVWNGTQLLFCSDSSTPWSSGMVLRSGLKDLIGVRADSMIANTEAHVLKALGL